MLDFTRCFCLITLAEMRAREIPSIPRDFFISCPSGRLSNRHDERVYTCVKRFSFPFPPPALPLALLSTLHRGTSRARIDQRRPCQQPCAQHNDFEWFIRGGLLEIEHGSTKVDPRRERERERERENAPLMRTSRRYLHFHFRSSCTRSDHMPRRDRDLSHRSRFPSRSSIVSRLDDAKNAIETRQKKETRRLVS